MRWVLSAACGLSPVAASGGYSSLWRVGFSLQWPLPPWSTGSRRVGFGSWGSRALERRLSSCGARVQPPRNMWDPPRPGIEPVSPALAGGPLTTAPPGKSPSCNFILFFLFYFFLKCESASLFIYLFIYLFIFGCVGSSFLCEGFL